MRFSKPFRLSWPLLGALAMLFHLSPAQAGMCSLPDNGNPIIAVNPFPYTVPPPADCLVNGLPGVGSDLPGYILKASRTGTVTAFGLNQGTYYDRVYCLGTGTTCDSSHTYIIATRFEVLPSGCFDFYCVRWDNIFRNIRGTTATPVAASAGYWMGSGSTQGTNANDSLSVNYLDYTGKTYKGSHQVTPPGSASDRDNSRTMYWTRLESDTVQKVWSPWFFVRQNCPFGGTGDHFQLSAFAIKFWHSGEELVVPTDPKTHPVNVQTSGYTCRTS
jgi:hypothetical protein